MDVPMGWRHTPEVKAPTWGWELLSGWLFRAPAWVVGTCRALGHPHEFGAPLALEHPGNGGSCPRYQQPHVLCPRLLTPAGRRAPSTPSTTKVFVEPPACELGVCGAGRGSGHRERHPDGTSRPSTCCHGAVGSAHFAGTFGEAKIWHLWMLPRRCPMAMGQMSRLLRSQHRGLQNISWRL